MRTILVLLAALALQACTALMVGGGSTGAYDPAEDPRQPAMSVSDASIVAAVGSSLDADPGLKMFGLGVRCEAGNVTLMGTVDTYAARERAEKLAMATKGVRSVENQIRVKGT